MPGARRWLIRIHRYLGIALSPLFLVWFLSGIAMVYARGMPEVNAETRLARLPVLDPALIRLTPFEASRLAGFGDHPERLILTSVLDRPAYRVGTIPVTILADTGERLDGIGESQAIAIARAFLDTPDNPDVRYARLVTEPDQWTLTQRRHLPLHKVLAADSSATELYISSRLGEVLVHTTARSRAVAWVSAIPHWLYFTLLRVNDRVWRQSILWLSSLASLSALLGLALAFSQFSVPYRGWLRWHYRAGAAFGVFAVTWTVSGFLSMEPWFWARSSTTTPADAVASALEGGALDLSEFPEIDAANWKEVLRDGQVREVEFLRVQGDPHLAARSSPPAVRILRAGARVEGREPFSVDSLIARVKTATSGSAIVDAGLIERPDFYYYSRMALPLPVLRVKLDNRDKTWLYIDPVTSRLVTGFTRRQRLQRWLYNGLHSLDFPFLYQRRPLWDIVVVTLCLGGAFLSFIGVVIAGRRVYSGVLRRS
jgi:PepSY-associated TM region